MISFKNKKEFTKIDSQIFVKFRLIFRRSYFWNTVYSEKGTVSQFLFLCFLSLLISFQAFYFEKFAWNDTYFPFHMVK
ncbi:hypothetical protein DQ190_05980 [Enterococcus faecium]|nr:hypothetical protein [Enterococcus faecium]EGP5737823.1 hypothetical protein [Enterococcus faecium]